MEVAAFAGAFHDLCRALSAACASCTGAQLSQRPWGIARAAHGSAPPRPRRLHPAPRRQDPASPPGHHGWRRVAAASRIPDAAASGHRGGCRRPRHDIAPRRCGAAPSSRLCHTPRRRSHGRGPRHLTARSTRHPRCVSSAGAGCAGRVLTLSGGPGGRSPPWPAAPRSRAARPERSEGDIRGACWLALVLASFSLYHFNITHGLVHRYLGDAPTHRRERGHAEDVI